MGGYIVCFGNVVPFVVNVKEDIGDAHRFLVKQFPTVNRVNIFRGERYNNQERPNILHGKVLATCVAILGEQTNTIRLINEMLHMPVNRD